MLSAVLSATDTFADIIQQSRIDRYRYPPGEPGGSRRFSSLRAILTKFGKRKLVMNGVQKAPIRTTLCVDLATLRVHLLAPFPGPGERREGSKIAIN